MVQATTGIMPQAYSIVFEAACIYPILLTLYVKQIVMFC